MPPKIEFSPHFNELVERLIAENRLFSALELFQNTDLNSEASIIYRSLKELEDLFNTGRISLERYEIQKNNIAARILNLKIKSTRDSPVVRIAIKKSPFSPKKNFSSSSRSNSLFSTFIFFPTPNRFQK